MYFKCPICNKVLGEVTPSHAKIHGMTKKQMLEKYPNLKLYAFSFGSHSERRLRDESATKTLPR